MWQDDAKLLGGVLATFSFVPYTINIYVGRVFSLCNLLIVKMYTKCI